VAGRKEHWKTGSPVGNDVVADLFCVRARMQHHKHNDVGKSSHQVLGEV
jgi:hypothetical protein